MATALSADEISHLLLRTSRTFALAIPLLEEPLRAQVGIAYLLFRIADTLEDAPEWARDRRVDALRSFALWIEHEPGAHEGARRWQDLVRDHAPTRDEGCTELLARAEDVRAAARATSDAVFAAMQRHTRRTALGMAEFVARQDERGHIVLADVDDLRRYAYAVAGIVGELLTDLFALAHDGVAGARAELDADAVLFGEGLQLVNILKDQAADARDGRSYLPPDVPKAAIFELSRSDLARAKRYVETLVAAGAPPGMIAFCDLPVRLADATLDALEAGAPKLSRDEVMRLFASVTGRAT